ncbi:hypothetical protein B484DRAFT_449636 [Ochromonadaceae sp. CCMP2298]|nr:hypothetical protein B484DRAFT_449636 [Ochromonadaceae sp. CCMP2298]
MLRLLHWLLPLLLALRATPPSAALSHAYCSEQYGNMTYIAETEMFSRYPPHLLSFMGAGSAWLRLLVEYATGVYSGSMDTTDFEYKETKIFGGERFCGLRMVMLRSHPHFFDFLNGKLRFRHNPQRDKCKKGLIREMKRIILLVRNPYDALWSNYQLLHHLSHAEYLTTSTFNEQDWGSLVPHMAMQFNSEFHTVVLPVLETFQPADVTVIKYEDLLDPEKGPEALATLVRTFMRFKVTDEALKCAFVLADKPQVHRNKHDPHRVNTRQAYLGQFNHTMGHIRYHNSLCMLREHVSAFCNRFDYPLLPSALEGETLPEDFCSFQSVWKVTEMEIEAQADAVAMAREAEREGEAVANADADF